MKNKIFLILFPILLFSCIQKPIVKRGYIFPSAPRIAIYELSSPENYKNAGAAAAQYIASLFLKYNFSVTLVSESSDLTAQGVDLIIKGAILRYTPENTQIIYSETSTGKKKQMIKYNEAVVSLNIVAIDAKTGEIVWTNSFSYEALDIDTALYYAVRGDSFTSYFAA